MQPNKKFENAATVVGLMTVAAFLMLWRETSEAQASDRVDIKSDVKADADFLYGDYQPRLVGPARTGL